MRTTVVRSIHDLDEERWDALAATELTMSHRWHRVMEASRVGYRPRYLLAEDDRGPLLLIVADANPSAMRSGWIDFFARRLTLVVGAPFSSRHSGIVMRSDASMSDVERCLAYLARHERRPLIGVSNVATSSLPDWTGRGYNTRPQPPRMVLDLATVSYEQYLQRLPKRDRQEVRRVRRRASEAGVTLSHAPLYGHVQDLYPLFAEVSERHGSKYFSAELFPSLLRELPGEVLVMSGEVGGEVGGYVLCLRQGEALMAILAGLRYELARRSSLYFALVDEMVRWSLEQGIQRIHAGISNEAQKQRHGFQPRARWLCLRAYPSPLNRLIPSTT
jgi:predicted N-acyltransferase